MNSKRTKCVIYARVSSKEQEEKGYSIQEQIRLLKDYAEKNRFKIVGEYTDVETAFGKKKTERKIRKVKREKFLEMVEFLQNNHPEIRTILVEKTDRLYRNFRDYVTLEDLDLEIPFAFLPCTKENLSALVNSS